MYEKLNITENHLNVLSLFTKGFDKDYYIREVERILKISPRTSQLILVELEKKGVLTSQMKGKIRIYKLHNTGTAKDYMTLAEQYKKTTFLESDSLMKELASKIVKSADGIVAVFGSYAKRTQKEGSDVDVFIAGKCDVDKIRRVSKLYGIEISVKKYPLKTFKEKFKSDILIKEVLENHIILSGLEEFMGVVMSCE